MKKDPLDEPLTVEEQQFATDNHYLVYKYLRLRKLPPDDWYDVVIFRYLRSVKRWFAFPELHDHNFEIIAFYAMRSAKAVCRRVKELYAPCVKCNHFMEVVRCKDCKYYWLPQGFCTHDTLPGADK